MAKAVFTTKINPGYDDLPEVRYHFGREYLRRVEQTLGEMIVYYEPRRSSTSLSSRSGRQSYFAVARPYLIEDDKRRHDHFYCRVSDYLDFDRPVPFKEGGDYYESALVRADGETNKGAFGHAVRLVPEEEFESILAAGYSKSPVDFAVQPEQGAGVAEEPAYFERPMVELAINKPFRDVAFRRSVRAAYDNRCAITGLRLMNGGGRPEVQAAHIQAVEDRGPDSVRNGLALSGTVHWLFDRGLLAVADDMRILTAKSHIPDEVARLINPSGYLNLPTDPLQHPHSKFLAFHRENRFKGEVSSV